MTGIIQHPQFGEVRTEKHNGEHVFCAADICEVLNHTNSRVLVQMLDEDERCKKSLRRGNQSLGNDEAWFVTESGLYALILKSNKPEARKFRKWITSEVLPALRKYGTYSTEPRVMDRLMARAEKKSILKMLNEVDSKLSATDKRLVAKSCLTDEYQVRKVLRGEIKDPHMLTMLYARATGNIKLNQMFYTQEGAEILVRELHRAQIR